MSKKNFYVWESAGGYYRVLPPTKFCGKINLNFNEKILAYTNISLKQVLIENNIDTTDYPLFTINNLTTATKIKNLLNKNLRLIERSK